MEHLQTRKKTTIKQRETFRYIPVRQEPKKGVLYNCGPYYNKGGGIYSYLCGSFPITPHRGNKYIYVIYIYDCNNITTVAIKNISNKEMIRVFA